MKSLKVLVLLVSTLFIAACSDENDNKASKDHVWKEQTDTIDKAKEVEAMMLKSAEDRSKSIDEQMQ